MVNRKSWEEFRNTGLMLIINQILHVFGWAIVVVVKNDKVIRAYPARVKFRGFDEESTDAGYKKVSEYLKNESEQLYKETQE